MKAGRNAVNLDKTLSHTSSSFYYKDPFNPSGSILYKIKNMFLTFFSVRNIENEFVDFKIIDLDQQIPEIYKDIAHAQKRRDKVMLQRSTSEAFYKYLINKSNRASSSMFLDEVNKIKLVHARIYNSGDTFMAEDQWAQITLSLNNKEQYVMFERRLSDKLTYLDWKMCFVLEAKDFEFIHAKHNFKVDTSLLNPDDLLSYEEKVRSKLNVKKDLYV